MQFTANHIYKHPAGDLFAMMTDFELVRAKYEALGHSNVQLVRREEGDDGSVVLVTRRVVPLELPGFAKKVLSPKQHVVQTDEWSAPDAKGRRTGSFTVEAKGTPVRVHGTLHLSPKGAKGCTNVTEVTVECKLPFIGGKIADLVAKDTRRAVDHEQSWMSAELSAA
ncbi:MAG TPA: DUF2505 domain-containing protein [Ilumatobacteraceae bacterium]|nr:DUF2505 domain-containing protein [Ilumatobacteraceae bacterium]